MKIIAVIPYGNIKMDSDVYCDALEKLGHTVVRVIFYNNKLIFSKDCKEADLIWCPYEQEIDKGLFLRDSLNIPVVGHYEWVPPWRVNTGSLSEWGYDNINEIVEETSKISTHRKNYEYWLNCYEKCDLKTTPSSYCLNTIKSIRDINTYNIFEKPYIIDDQLLLKYKDDAIVKKNQILSIARLVPHKRISHVIKALSLVKNAPVLKIIGYGPEKIKLENLAEDLNVNVEFVGEGQSGDKAKFIQESLFLVTPYASLPAGEAALFKVPTILYDIEAHLTKHPNIGKYVKKDSIEELAKAIQDWIDNPSEVAKEGEKNYNNLINGSSGLNLSETAAKKMVKIFKKVIK